MIVFSNLFPLNLLPKDPTRRGISYALIAMFLFSMMAALAKHFSATYSIYQIAFFRFFFALTPLIPLIAQNGGLEIFKTNRLKDHIWRSGVGLTSLIFYFLSIKHLPLSDAVSISFSNPLFIALLSIFLLKEKVGIHRWGAIILGFCGVVLIAKPQGDLIDIGVLYGVLSAMFYALAMISLRTLGSTEKIITTTTYFTLISTIMLSVPAAIEWTAPKSFFDFILFAASGVCAGIGQLFLTKAYQLASPTIISPFNYTAILWAVLIGFIVWEHVPSFYMWLGASIVIGSGLYIIHRERIKKKDPIPPSSPAM
jgi:drug/metabolite transporter (DMT)-like permease